MDLLRAYLVDMTPCHSRKNVTFQIGETREPLDINDLPRKSREALNFIIANWSEDEIVEESITSMAQKLGWVWTQPKKVPRPRGRGSALKKA